jgi:hypothetical protein
VQALLGTQSIIMIPGDDDQPIQLIHTSLRDFLTMHSCSGEYFVDPLMRHLFITADCLAAMMVWPKEGVIYDGGWKYACLNWCYHLHLGLVGARGNLLDSLSNTSLKSVLQDFASSFDI